MTRREARGAALAALARWRQPARWRTAADLAARVIAAYIRYGIPLLSLLVGGIVWGLEDWVGAGITAAILTASALVALLGVAAVAFGLGHLLCRAGAGLVMLLRGNGERAHEALRLVPGDPEPLPPVRTVRLRGRVRVTEPIPSPLAHAPCAAFRLVGEGPLGPVDDAGGTSFELTTEGGPVRVELGRGSVDVPVEAVARTVRPDRSLARFLEERGIYPDRGPVRLAEGLLRDGDVVEVEGQLDSELASDGYRGTHRIRVLREHPGAPLRVRKAR